MSSNQNILVKLNRAGFSLNNKWLVKGVSLQVEKGKIVTLIGPNGSGKSTTAKIALGIYKKIDGSVEKYTSKVGYVPQKISIDWTLPLRVNDFMVLTESISNKLIDEAFTKFYVKEKNIFQKNQKDNNDIFFNPIDIGDNTIPNGNAMMLINLVRLGKMKEAKILSDSLNGYLNIYKNHMMTAVRALDYFNNINSGKKCTEQGCTTDEAKN